MRSVFSLQKGGTLKVLFLFLLVIKKGSFKNLQYAWVPSINNSGTGFSFKYAPSCV